MKSPLENRLTKFFVSYFTLTDQLVPQAEAEADIREGVSFRGMSIIILIIAILIASLGLNTNSTAVIIGAMLISPLMGPIIGIGLGVGIHDFTLITRGLRNLLMAAAFSVLASTLYFLISPVAEGHSELLARTSPTIYDVLIGFFGGFAGILAIGSRSKGNVIPGVAIATALMPPLCTAGYGIATWQLNYFFGATYLFIINSIYIAFATFIGVKLMKYRGPDLINNVRAKRVMHVVYAAAILTMLPSIWLTYNMLRQNKFSMNAQRFVAAECRFPQTRVLNTSAYYEDGVRCLDITLIGRVLPTDSLEIALTSQLPEFGLAGTRVHIIQGDSPTRAELLDASSNSVRDIYQVAQSTITRQQETIDSLRQINRLSAESRAAAATITPEVKVLFPQVGELSVSRSIFANVETGASDTINIALINFRRPMSGAERARLVEYLEARLKLTHVDIVEVGTGIFERQRPAATPAEEAKPTEEQHSNQSSR
ncbi:MAG: DUF389 domain-containing protein [Clostridium sp.]|nr:DUF389 domain-containing protein [Clostridium sp.]